MSCLFNPIGCAQNAALAALAGVPWWAWAALIVIALFAAWRLGGLPGLIAMAAGLGFAAGKFGLPKQQAEFDRQNDNSGDFFPKTRKQKMQQQPETWLDKVKRGEKAD